MAKIAAILRTWLRYDIPLWLMRGLTGWLPDFGPMTRIRGMLFAPFIGRCGKGFIVGRDVTLSSANRMVIGDYVYIAKGSWLDAFGGLEIESEVLIAPYVVIATSNHGFKDGSCRFGGTHAAPVKIGRGTWLGAHAVIAAGVSVGRGNLVGANAVVTKSTPDNVLVGGIPAKVVRERVDNPGQELSRHG